MPEGHVIHRLAARLNDEFRGAPLAASSPQGRFDASLIDAHPLIRAQAQDKHLFLEFAHVVVHIHLGLIGSLRFEPAEDIWGQIRLRLVPDGGEGTVAANLERSGEDPLDSDSDPDALWARVHRSKRTIGSLMMDQSYFAGVGNIYRAEPLFRQRISPFTPGRALDRAEFDALWEDLVELMRYGFEHGRIDTVRDEHSPEAMGRAPRKDDHGGEVYVYRRAGQPCYVCGDEIALRKVQGRNLFWCPTCQRD